MKARAMKGWLLAVALAALSFGACAQATPVQGGTLTYATDIEPPILVSLLDTNTRIRNISAKITEGLLRYDLDFRPQPLLATQWSTNPPNLSEVR